MLLTLEPAEETATKNCTGITVRSLRQLPGVVFGQYGDSGLARDRHVHTLTAWPCCWRPVGAQPVQRVLSRVGRRGRGQRNAEGDAVIATGVLRRLLAFTGAEVLELADRSHSALSIVKGDGL